MESDAHGVGGEVDDRRDLAGLEPFPGPEPHDLGVELAKATDRPTDPVAQDQPVDLVVGGVDHRLDRQSQGERVAPSFTPSGVRQAATGHSVGPGQLRTDRHVVETSPQDHQHIGDDVADLRRGTPPPDVALERIQHHLDQRVEAGAIVHTTAMSGWSRILSTGSCMRRSLRSAAQATAPVQPTPWAPSRTRLVPCSPVWARVGGTGASSS